MIDNQCSIYVINRGFVSAQEVSPGDLVYTLDGLKVEISCVDSVRSEFVYKKLNVVDSGQHNINATEDTLYLYHSDELGSKLISWNMIPKLTPDKAYFPKKYLPVLSHPFWAGKRNTSDVDLEYLARSIAVEKCDEKSFREIVSICTGEDAIALIDMLEFWVSTEPGIGWFGRAQVKARSHFVQSEYIADELCRIAVLAGYTALKTQAPNSWVVNVSFESRPIPGSRAKIEKYYKTNYAGYVYLINAKNRPILGMSKKRCFYLNTSSTIIGV